MEVTELQTYIKDPLNPDDFQVIKNECEDLIRLGDPEECKDLANYIGGILQEFAPRLQAQPQLYDLYQAYWHRLAFKAFVSLPLNIKTDLLQRRLLFAISKGFDPDHLIQKYFEAISDPQSLRAALTNFIKPLEQNTETIGSNPLVVGEQKYLPQLKNWILDYSKFPSLNARRGSIDRLNYVNQSQNVRALTQNQRQALLKVLKFYDDLLNPESSSFDSSVVEQPVEAVQFQTAVPQAQPQPQQLSQIQRPPQIDVNKKLQELKSRNQ